GWWVAARRRELPRSSPQKRPVLGFVLAGPPGVGLLPPPVPWTALIPTGLTLFAGQFLFQFFGIAHGMPPGLASVIVQSQALFTIVFAALALGERPSRAQWIGSAIALAGLALSALTIGGGVSPGALAVALRPPACFGVRH